ncbi:MAG: amidase [Cyanobacteria bacterium J06621_8]
MNSRNPEFTYIFPSATNNPDSLSDLRLGVKDLFHIAGIPTTAGNPDWVSSHPIPKVTAPSVKALIDAGANLIGKTLTDELAYSLEGINKHYGTPVNPQAPQRLPGGSSSGSAVAVANRSIDIGLGTDTGGSIRVPASYNGIYGFRPSHGAVDCEHLVPLSPRFDTVGWLTRDLATLNRVAQILLPSSIEHNLSQVVIAHLEGVPDWTKACQPWLETLSANFASLQEIEITREQLALASKAFRVLQGREIWRIHGNWIDLQQPDIAQEICDRFMWCKILRKEDEQDAELLGREFISFWHGKVLPTTNHFLLLPTTPGAAPLLNTPPAELTRYRTSLLGLTAPASLTRAPQISLPLLTSEEAPWGVSLIARSGCDRSLLDCAAKLERLKL